MSVKTSVVFNLLKNKTRYVLSTFKITLNFAQMTRDIKHWMWRQQQTVLRVKRLKTIFCSLCSKEVHYNAVTQMSNEMTFTSTDSSGINRSEHLKVMRQVYFARVWLTGSQLITLWFQLSHPVLTPPLLCQSNSYVMAQRLRRAEAVSHFRGCLHQRMWPHL